jgi:hypothetical protein
MLDSIRSLNGSLRKGSGARARYSEREQSSLVEGAYVATLYWYGAG